MERECGEDVFFLLVRQASEAGLGSDRKTTLAGANVRRRGDSEVSGTSEGEPEMRNQRRGCRMSRDDQT